LCATGKGAALHRHATEEVFIPAKGAALMILAALIAARFCVPAERKSLEAVAPPLSVIN
jgi:hypothetical protein